MDKHDLLNHCTASQRCVAASGDWDGPALLTLLSDEGPLMHIVVPAEDPIAVLPSVTAEVVQLAADVPPRTTGVVFTFEAWLHPKHLRDAAARGEVKLEDLDRPSTYPDRDETRMTVGISMNGDLAGISSIRGGETTVMEWDDEDTQFSGRVVDHLNQCLDLIRRQAVRTWN